MGNRPSSRFGFGVVISDEPFEESEEPGSPCRLYAWGEKDEGGVEIIRGGYYENGHFLLVVAASASASDDWSPQAITPEQVAATPEWSAIIEAYLDRWNLRGRVVEGFEKPGFLHSPYYG
jgi:hypothetical protein